MKLFRKNNPDGTINPIWYVSFWIKDSNTGEKKRVKRTTNCTDKRAADSVGKKIERDETEISLDPEKAEQQSATLETLMDTFLKNLRSNAKVGKKSPKTVTFYEDKSKAVIRGFGKVLALQEDEEKEWTTAELDAKGKDFRLVKLSAKFLDEFIEVRREMEVTELTISKELVCLRSALKIAKRRGLWSGDMQRIVPVGFSPNYQPRKRALNQKELDMLIKELNANAGAVVAFIVATSARFSEAMSAQREDIDLANGIVRIRGTKTEDSIREVPIVTEWQKKLIEHSLEYAESTDKNLFQHWDNSNANRDLEKACNRIKILKCTPNDLRRTCATWLRVSGIPLELVAPVMGHKTTQMVQLVYGRLSGMQLKERMNQVLEGTGTAKVLNPNNTRTVDVQVITE